MKVTVDRQALEAAVGKGLVSREQAEDLWLFWGGEIRADEGDARLPLSRFFYYFGAIIVIGAMGWFMNTAWEKFSGFGLLTIAASYALAFILAARYFRNKSEVLSGLLVAMAVCMTPLAVYGFQKGLNIWPLANPGNYRGFFVWVKSGWFAMEVATVVTGIIGMRFARIPFAMAPVAFTLWFMSMDITPILFGDDRYGTYHKYVSIAFGLVMIAVAFGVDRRQRVDYAKWLYIFGMIAFWGGLTTLNSQSELSRAGYCAINVFLMICGVLLERKVFLVFGAIGTFGYVGHLAWSVFRDSLFFPFVLSLVGLGIVYTGWLYHRKQAAIIGFVRRITPAWLLKLLPQNRN
jgi:hypothetical protein